MFKRFSVPVLVLALLHVGSALGQQPQEYPVLDRIAQKVIDKYANSTCEQLAQMKSEKPSGEKAEMEQRASRCSSRIRRCASTSSTRSRRRSRTRCSSAG